MLLLSAAIVVLGIVDGIAIGVLAATLSGILLAAATGRLPVLANPVLAWLGAISYTLYLVHENIGWGFIRWLEEAGLNSNLAIVAVVAIVLVMATLLTRMIERPAMKWLRQRYRERLVRKAA